MVKPFKARLSPNLALHVTRVALLEHGEGVHRFLKGLFVTKAREHNPSIDPKGLGTGQRFLHMRL